MKVQKFTHSRMFAIRRAMNMCVFLFICSCASVHMCVWVCGSPCTQSCEDNTSFSVSVEIPFSKNGSHDCFLELNNFRSNLLFCGSSTIYSVSRNFSAFSDYVQCISRHPDTCVNVHHWLTAKGFNSSNCFRHRLCWNILYLFLCIIVAVCLPSKNNFGIDVTSHIFLGMILFEGLILSLQ
jgi:hypothetical protein